MLLSLLLEVTVLVLPEVAVVVASLIMVVSLKNNDVLFNINLADSDEEKEVFEQHNVVNTKKLARTTSRISNYFFGKKGILNNFRTLRSHDSSKISKVLHELPTSAAPKMTSASVNPVHQPDKPNADQSEAKEPQDLQVKQNIHLYIQKLHLKFTELISVLADYRVHIFLSGTQTDYNLGKYVA